MSKELEELTRIENNITYLLSDCEDIDELVECFKSVEEHKSCEIIRQALQRLESIDNAKPSEALEDLEKMVNLAIQVDDEFELLDDEFGLYHNKVKKYILKTQENEKVLSIIKEKNVDIKLLKLSTTWLDYYTRVKHKTGEDTKINDNEFELLKEMIK